MIYNDEFSRELVQDLYKIKERIYQRFIIPRKVYLLDTFPYFYLDKERFHIGYIIYKYRAIVWLRSQKNRNRMIFIIMQ